MDAGFGQIKKLYRRTDCDTKEDIARVIELSSKSNKAVRFSDDAWVWRDWKEYLSVRFKAVKVHFYLIKIGNGNNKDNCEN